MNFCSRFTNGSAMRAHYALKVPLGGRTVKSQQPTAEVWGREISGRPELTSSNGHPGQECHNGAFFRWRRLLSFLASRTARRSDSSTKRPRFRPTRQECGKTEKTGRVVGFWGLDASAIHNFHGSLSASGGALVKLPGGSPKTDCLENQQQSLPELRGRSENQNLVQMRFFPCSQSDANFI